MKIYNIIAFSTAYLVMAVIALIILFNILSYRINKSTDAVNKLIGTSYVTKKKDTVTIIAYSILYKQFTLDNNQEVAPEYLLTLEILPKK